jgi:hypothetical protein
LMPTESWGEIAFIAASGAADLYRSRTHIPHFLRSVSWLTSSVSLATLCHIALGKRQFCLTENSPAESVNLLLTFIGQKSLDAGNVAYVGAYA